MNQVDELEPAERVSDIDQYLDDIISNEPNSIRASVAREALDYYDVTSFFTDILQHGCISGMVGSLIYYTDTHAYFDKHYEAIERVRDEVEENLGEALNISGDLKNCLAWFAFEETAYQLGLEMAVFA